MQGGYAEQREARGGIEGEDARRLVSAVEEGDGLRRGRRARSAPGLGRAVVDDEVALGAEALRAQGKSASQPAADAKRRIERENRLERTLNRLATVSSGAGEKDELM